MSLFGFKYADILYGPEHHSQEDRSGSGDGDSDDIEDALAKEVKELQAPCQERRFQAIISGANNLNFIKTNLPDSKDPADLVHFVLEDIMKTQCKKTRLDFVFAVINNDGDDDDDECNGNGNVFIYHAYPYTVYGG